MRLITMGRGIGLVAMLTVSTGCSSTKDGMFGAGANAGGRGDADGGTGNASGGPNAGGSSNAGGSQSNDRGGEPGSAGSGPTQAGPSIEGCAVFPRDHLFNTPIDTLPTHPQSSEFINAVGVHRIHLDLGTSVDPKSEGYYGIPYNVVHSRTLPWVDAAFGSSDPTLDWNAEAEADCALGPLHTLTSPCVVPAGAKAQFPMPTTPLVEGGIVTDPAQPYGDHHVLLLDADECTLWELYHAYPDARGGWDIFGAAFFDLGSNQLRPAGWTSADAAGFAILPLLLRAAEASSGVIRHALRFTIPTTQIREQSTWPARHLTRNANSSSSLPAMGQAFRLKPSYVIPAAFNVQSRAILQALKSYGMYLADGGSALYVQGEPSAAWQSETFSQVQSVASSEFEAVDLTPIEKRPGFDPNSARVP